MPEAIHTPHNIPLHDAPKTSSDRRVEDSRLRTLKRPLNNLPFQLTSFIGRERELAEVEQLLASTRLLTLTGPGGCGKTRLALEVAVNLAAEYADGVWWVELASLSDPALIPQAVASVLDVREQPSHSLIETLLGYLRAKHLLLVLDNCEHLVEACAALVDTLLHACTNLQILTTSREPLSIAGEIAWLVPSLSLPAPGHLLNLEENFPSTLAQYAAIRLFLERARAVLPTFTLTQQNARAVAQVCQRLDGIPLAIELAAARVKVLGVEQIGERLDDCFRLLTTGSRTALLRHQTLRATIDWSYDLLLEQERILFGRLSAFAGGWTLAAAESVCAGDGIEEHDILDLLSHLVDRSLVVMQEQDGQARYWLLETIRQYGWQKLLESGKTKAVRRQHASFFLCLAEEVEPKLISAERGIWLHRLEVEHDNLRAALRWAVEAGDVETGLRLAGALWWFWLHRGYWSEGRGWLEGALRMAEASAPTTARAKALLGAGWLAFAQGDHTTARSRLEESMAVSWEIPDRESLAYSQSFLSLVLVHQGDPTAARPLAEESVAIFREEKDKWGLAISLTHLGIVAEAEADYVLAISLFEESVTLFREMGDKWALSLPLRHLGIVTLRQGDHVRAIALYKESLALCRELGERWLISLCLEELAGAVCIQGDYLRAVRLLGAEEALREAISAAVRALYRADYDRTVAAVRAGLGEEAFAAAWAEGRAMPLEQAIDYALATNDQRPTACPERSEGTNDQQPVLSGAKELATKDAKRSSLARLLSPAEPREVPQPELRIFALGAARVERGEYVLTSADWTYAKPRELLFYLLCHPARTKEQIGLALWPDASATQLRSSFHVTLHHLRRALGQPKWIIFENNRYTFNRSLSYWLDVEAFESNLLEARQLQTEAPAQAINCLEQAVKLYSGDFLEDFVAGDWYLLQREALRQKYLQALLTLGQLYFNEGHYTEAADAYRQLIAQDNLLEPAHRELMRCYTRLGERGQALRHYQALVELLHDELGSLPDAETIGLFECLRRGEDI